MTVRENMGFALRFAGHRSNLTVDIVEHLGGETFAYARHGTGELLTLATNNDRNLGSGDSYEAHFNPASMLIFSESGTRIR